MKVLVIDNGLNTEFARVLGGSSLFSRVDYFAPWQADFVATRERAVGTGFDEFDRIFSIDEDTLEGYDAFVFPDLYWSDLAIHLSQDYPVWASFDMEQLELERNVLLDTMKELDMDMPHHKVVKGIDAALKIAQDGDFIKIPGYSRWDMETCKHQKVMPIWYRTLREKLGPLADTVPIIVEKKIEDDHECGWDTIVIMGRALWPMMLGYEEKDSGYLSTLITKFPEVMAENSWKMLRYIENSPYTNFLSTEFRGQYLIDITCRAPSPPSDVHMGFWKNFTYLVSDYLNGDADEADRLIPSHKYAAELILKNHAEGEWPWLRIPPELRDHVGIRRGFMRDGLVWQAPPRDNKMEEVGSIWAGGSSPEAAIKEVARIKDELEMADFIEGDENVFDGLKKKAEKGLKHGIQF